ncbi:MAG: recombination protein RecR [Bacteroidia bacterium]|nr:recombination protein RecR [Bacteroidia bacterium]
MNFSSRVIEDAVNEFSRLPGVGKKTALRYVLEILKRDTVDAVKLTEAIRRLKEKVRPCKECHNLTETDTCDICSSTDRDRGLLCVVEDIRDVISIENTGQYRGLYHVLGGIISPMDGVGPSDLTIDSLTSRVSRGEVREVILALSTTMEGETTNFYLYKKLLPAGIKISTLARGVSVGDNLEYADEVTLGRSILHRTPYETTFNQSKGQ